MRRHRSGSLGLAAGANIGDSYGMFGAVHGSAPKYTGINRVNPVAMIMASAMMLDYLGEKTAAKKVEQAILSVLSDCKVRTADLGGSSTMTQMTEATVSSIKRQIMTNEKLRKTRRK